MERAGGGSSDREKQHRFQPRGTSTVSESSKMKSNGRRKGFCEYSGVGLLGCARLTEASSSLSSKERILRLERCRLRASVTAFQRVQHTSGLGNAPNRNGRQAQHNPQQRANGPKSKRAICIFCPSFSSFSSRSSLSLTSHSIIATAHHLLLPRAPEHRS